MGGSRGESGPDQDTAGAKAARQKPAGPVEEPGRRPARLQKVSGEEGGGQQGWAA